MPDTTTDYARGFRAGIEAVLNALDERLTLIGGCGDGGCLVMPPKGMHTNGGCRCMWDKYKAQQVVNAHKAFEAEVSTLKRPEPSEGERVEKVAAVIERELMIDESLLADPATLRKIKSQRIARAALAAGRV